MARHVEATRRAGTGGARTAVTIRLNRVTTSAVVAAALSASVVIGTSVALAPGMAIVMCAVVIFLAAAACGPQVVLCIIIAAFPVVPSTIQYGATFLTPNRLLVGLLLFVVLAEPRLWDAHAWRMRIVRRPLRFFGAFLAIGLISAAASPLPANALAGVGFYAVQVGGAILAACVLARSEHTERYLTAISVGAIGVGLLALAQYVLPSGVVPQAFGPVFVSDEATSGTLRALPIRVSGPFPHPVALGAYGALTLPFALRASVSENRRCAVLGNVAVVMLLAAILLSQTRMAMIAAFVVLTVWLGMSSRRRNAAGLLVMAAVALVAVFGTSALATQAGILRSTLAAARQSVAPADDPGVQSVVGRKTLYETGWRALKARPLIGYGMRVPTNHAQSDFFTRHGQSLAFESYLIVLPLEVGLLGFVAFVGFLFALIRALLPNIPSASDRATVTAAGASGATMALASNLFDANIFYFWLLVGLIAATALRAAADRI
jgi:hypothetical protein